MIASDVDNPNFVGAQNPDSRLAVRFYSKSVQNAFETERQGRPIFFDVDYVQIFVPGDQNSVIDTIARDDHKNRFPVQWARFKNTKDENAHEMGTPLKEWPRISASQAEELRALKFYTVEAIANASDAAIQNVGMIAGMSPYAFREHAQRFLKVATEDASINETEEKNKQLEAELELNRVRMAEMEAKLAQLLEQKPTAKRGRKPKTNPQGE